VPARSIRESGGHCSPDSIIGWRGSPCGRPCSICEPKNRVKSGPHRPQQRALRRHGAGEAKFSGQRDARKGADHNPDAEEQSLCATCIRQVTPTSVRHQSVSQRRRPSMALFDIESPKASQSWKNLKAAARDGTGANPGCPRTRYHLREGLLHRCRLGGTVLIGGRRRVPAARSKRCVSHWRRDHDTRS
jgi:hypothetical protein